MKTLLLVLISFTLSAQSMVGIEIRPILVTPAKPTLSKYIDVKIVVPNNSCLEKTVNCGQLPIRCYADKEKLKIKYPGIKFIEVQIEYSDGRIQIMTLDELRNLICCCQT